MITFKPAVKGYRAHWEIEEPKMTELLTEQFENRSGLSVAIGTDLASTPVQEVFHQGEPVVIILPEGRWRTDFSADGVSWYNVSALASNGAMRINFILDGEKFPRRWVRYAKVIRSRKTK